MMQKNNVPPCRTQIAGLVLVLMVTAMLAGCGKKGNPEPPPGEPNTYPRTYPVQ
jgi:predicted small lipoprotein YifL